MSHYDYTASQRLAAQDPPFAALIMAAMRKGDTDNMAKLRAAFPDIYEELRARYNARGGGWLPGERGGEAAKESP